MENLPPEIICHIGDFLKAEKISFSLTCKSLNQVLKSDVEKIKKCLIDFKNNVPYEVYYLLRNNDVRSTIKIKTSGTVYTKIFEEFPGRDYILSHMSKLLKVEPELIYQDDEHGEIRFNYKNGVKFAYLIKDLLDDTIYSNDIKSEIEDMLLDLIGKYKYNLKGFEEFIRGLREVFDFIEIPDDLI
jgi:hypothetical protein